MQLLAYLFFAFIFSMALAALYEIFSSRSPTEKSAVLLFSLALYVFLIISKAAPGWPLNIAILLFAFSLGLLISRTTRSSAALITFLIAAAITDYFSFSGGLTQQIVASAKSGSSQILNYLAISVFLFGKRVILLGIGDLVIYSAIYVAMRELSFPKPVSFFAPFFGLALAIVIGTFTGGIFAIPFISFSVIIAIGLSDFFRKKQAKPSNA